MTASLPCGCSLAVDDHTATVDFCSDHRDMVALVVAPAPPRPGHCARLFYGLGDPERCDMPLMPDGQCPWDRKRY